MLETLQFLWIRETECAHKVSIVVIDCIISRNQNIAVTFHSKIMFLCVH